MEQVVSATYARIHFGELMRQAVRTGKPVIVERAGKPCVAVLSIEAYRRLCNPGAEQAWHQALAEVIRLGAQLKARRQGAPLSPPPEAGCPACRSVLTLALSFDCSRAPTRPPSLPDSG